MDDDSAELVRRWRDGDQQAAEALYRRYAERLMALARSRLSEKLSRRLDAEDVVQSAYRSFFAGACADRFVLQRGGDLWRLLVAITLHKLQHQVEHHRAAKRSIDRERTLDGDDPLSGVAPELVAREPSPAEAAAVVDELEAVLRRLSPSHRRMVELRLQGHTIEEIATDANRSERMVRLVMEQVKERFGQRLCREGSLESD